MIFEPSQGGARVFVYAEVCRQRIQLDQRSYDGVWLDESDLLQLLAVVRAETTFEDAQGTLHAETTRSI